MQEPAKPPPRTVAAEGADADVGLAYRDEPVQQIDPNSVAARITKSSERGGHPRSSLTVQNVIESDHAQ